MVVRRVEEIWNHLVRALVVTLAGQGGNLKSVNASLTVSQCRRAQCRVGGGKMMAGGLIVTTVGTWSESVEGRGVSQEDTNAESTLFVKAKCSTEGLEMVSKGKRV